MARRNTTPEPTNEQIFNILHDELTNVYEKQRLLISIGLSEIESQLLATYVERKRNESENENASATENETPQITPETTPHLWQIIEAGLANYTFGVEIECFAPRGTIVDNATNQGLDVRSEGYNHDDVTDHHKLVSDGSLCGCPDPVEFVTAVLPFENVESSLKAITKTLAASNAKVNKSCGLHVHVATPTLTDAQYCNVFVNYMHLEPLIDSWLAPSRKNNEYSRSLRSVFSSVMNATNPSEMARACGCSRYYKVNPMAYSRHRTIEFRQHQGTVEFEKIFNWLRFCAKLVEFSKDHRLNESTAPTQIEDIEFLNDNEKAYFKARAAHFASRAESIAA